MSHHPQLFSYRQLSIKNQHEKWLVLRVYIRFSGGDKSILAETLIPWPGVSPIIEWIAEIMQVIGLFANGVVAIAEGEFVDAFGEE